MYLVKNCHKETNLKTCGTLKIGTLQEYRETFEQQVLDTYEGTFAVNMKLKDMHIYIPFFNFLFGNHHSHLTIPDANFSIGKRSAIFPEHIIVDKFESIINFNNHNRFIYCLSKVENPSDGFGIFNDYNSLWYFKFDHIIPYAEIISYCLIKHVMNLLNSGAQIFTKTNKITKLNVKFKIQNIIYSDRNTIIDNKMLYAESQYVVELFKNIVFTKPADFKDEKEVRILFDFFDGDEMLYPSVKYLIINAKPLIPFVTVS